jgi:hypothetical protein
MRKIFIGLMGFGAVVLFGAASVQAGDGITYAFPTCDDDWYARNNPSCSPEQRQRAEQKKREREAAEAKRKAEQARKDAAVAAEVQKLGSHRVEEARRLVEMREAAARAAGRPVPAPTPAAKPPALKCEMRTVTRTVGSGFKNSEAIARTAFVDDARRQCGYATGTPTYSGMPTCETSDQSLYAAMPIGKRPKSSPVQMMTRCYATVTCTERKKVCESTSSGRASAQ